MGDHTESIQIEYDPAILPTEELLGAFWGFHSPTSRTRSTQYRAALFYRNKNEKEVFRVSKENVQKTEKSTVHTNILPFTTFTLAEDYHQKYYLRSRQTIFSTLKMTDRELIESSLACYLNALVSGNCSEERMAEILEFAREQNNERLVLALEKYILGKGPSTMLCGSV